MIARRASSTQTQTPCVPPCHMVACLLATHTRADVLCVCACVWVFVQINNIIIELQVRGGQRNVPASIDERMPKARSTLKDIAGLWLKALNSKRRRRNAKEGAHPFLVTFRDPEEANKPTKRRRAPAKRGVVAENSAPKKRARRTAKAKADAPKANGTGARKPRKTKAKAPSHATFAVKPHNADFCYVCREAEGFADNPIVFCEGCNLAVHQVRAALMPLQAHTRVCSHVDVAHHHSSATASWISRMAMSRGIARRAART